MKQALNSTKARALPPSSPDVWHSEGAILKFQNSKIKNSEKTQSESCFPSKMIGSHQAITRVAWSRSEQAQEGFPKKFSHRCNKNKQKKTLKGFKRHHGCLDGLSVHCRACVSLFEFGALLKGTSAVLRRFSTTSLCDQNTVHVLSVLGSRNRRSDRRPFLSVSKESRICRRSCGVVRWFLKSQSPFGVATVDLGVYKDGNRCASTLLKH